MRTLIFLLLLTAALVACESDTAETISGTVALPRPSQLNPAAINPSPGSPRGDFFYSLPHYSTGETVTLDGYTIQVVEVAFDGGQLSLDLELGNESGRPIDTNWAVQLIREGQGYIAPTMSPAGRSRPGDALLNDGDNLGGKWVYDLRGSVPAAESSIDLDDYRLLYAPFGWSGPVFIFNLSPTAHSREVARS